MNYQIFNEDCLEGMKKIADGSVDAIICDLPFGSMEQDWDKKLPIEPKYFDEFL